MAPEGRSAYQPACLDHQRNLKAGTILMALLESKASGTEKEGHEVLDNISKLELRILALERDKISHFHSWRHEFHATANALEDVEIKLASESKEKGKELFNQVKQIKKYVANFSDMLKDLNSGQAFVEKLKCTMEEIEISITTFKRKHGEEFELLLQEEEMLTQEVTAFDKKLESWSAVSSTKPVVVTMCMSGALAGRQRKPETDTTPPPVLAFERFLQQTGGHQGGWDDYDHQTFLKLCSKYSDLSVFLERAIHELPTKSLSEIQQHEQWYTEYSTLLNNKKKAIATWKRQKQSEHEDTETDKDLLGTKGQNKRNEILAKEREERFARLPAWKAQQEYNHTKLKEEILRVEIDNRKDIEKEKKRRVLIKKQVEDYIQSREDREKFKRLGIEIERTKEKERRKTATKEVARFRERDLTKVAEKQAKLKEKAEEKYWREKNLKQQIKVNAVRDPARLLKPTASMKEKGKGGPGSGLSGVVLVMPRRAVPSWRQT